MRKIHREIKKVEELLQLYKEEEMMGCPEYLQIEKKRLITELEKYETKSKRMNVLAAIEKAS